MNRQDSAEPDGDSDSSLPQSPARMLYTVGTARAEVIAAKARAEAAALAPMMADIADLERRANAIGDRRAITLCHVAVLAAHRGDHAELRRAAEIVAERLEPRPTVSDDQRASLIKAIGMLGLEACAEATKIARDNARRK